MTCSASQPQRTLRTAAHLVEAGLLADDLKTSIDRLSQDYALAITPALAALIDPNDTNDPIGKQFLPDLREFTITQEERNDPIGDHAHEKTTGLIHRYEDKALLKIVGTCPVYCRFCFRREMVGPAKGETLSRHEIDLAIDYIAATPALKEIIITGGDPLILSVPRLQDLATRLGTIAHLETIRWHTRLPVALPEQITEECAQALTASGKPTRLALHINHPKEFSPALRHAIKILQKQKIEILSQSVLLKDINTDLAALDALKACFDATGMTPYYIHHPDLAKGTSHFRFPLQDGIDLIRAWHERHKGLSMPRYMLDLPGGFGKVDLLSGAVQKRGHDTFEITDRTGRMHLYQSAVASSSSL
jgi:lysine 2,3-aminomutase